MRFERLPLAAALGQILGHNIAGEEGRRRLRKGKAMGDEDLALLAALGHRSVFVALPEPGDVLEDEAARRVAAGLVGPGLKLSRASTGRVNVHAEALGLLRVDLERLTALNTLPGLSLATALRHAVLEPGSMAATLKVIPYAVPETTVAAAADLLAPGPLLYLTALPETRTALILSGSPGARERIEHGFRSALEPRLRALGSRLADVAFVPLEDDDAEERLAAALAVELAAGVDLVVLAGDTAVMDRRDVAPRAIERVGGTVELYGAPVDPGNLLLLAYRGATPMLGAPGCARSPKTNVVDLVLPRLLAGDRLSAREIAGWGHGGLLEDVPERPLPRSWLG